MKYINYSICLMAVILITVGCSDDFLDRPPKSEIVDANFYQNDDQVLAGTAPLYNIVWFAYNDKASHGLGDARGGVLTSGSYQLENVQMNTTATTAETGTSWRSFYNIVGQANLAIQNINNYAGDAVSDEVKKHAIAEARFMRAVAYSYLVMNWGPVPIITNNFTLLSDTSQARHTIPSVWQFITSEMRAVSNDLMEEAPLEGRINNWAAEGMLARFYMTRAGVEASPGNRNQTFLDSAKYFAQRVINNSGASLLPNYQDLFFTSSNNNSESLFALQWFYNGDWGAQNSVQAFLAYGSEITGFGDGWGGDIGASLYMLDKYEGLIDNGSTPDRRLKSTFMLPGAHYPYISQAQIDEEGNQFIQELRVPVGGNGYNTRAWVKKYVVGRPEDNDGKVLQQRTEINTYMLRLAEVYLIYAEAELGNQTSTTDAQALDYFNRVRTRAGLPAMTSITFEDIFDERLVEFAMEGMAWYDFVRLHYYNPDAAYTILSNQDRGFYRITPNQIPNPTSWTFELDPNATVRTYTVNSGNFYIPIPAQELSRAPNLAKPPVDYYAN